MSVVDLTRTLGPDITPWPGSSAPVFTPTATFERDGSFARDVAIPEHIGTHVDAPAHFIEGGATADQIPVEQLICDLAVVDIRDKASKDPDYLLSVADLEHDEATQGPIPQGAVVAVSTGWSARTGADVYGFDANGGMHYPGVGLAAAECLVKDRCIAGLGIDTPSVDPGSDTTYEVHSRVTLPRRVWHIEGLINLDRVPARGATVFVGLLPLAGGSGAPARVIAKAPS